MDPDNNFSAGGEAQTTKPAEATQTSPFAIGNQSTMPVGTQAEANIQEPVAAPQPPVQQISPLDSPPPPPTGSATDATSELKGVISPTKAKGKFPILAILITLIILVLAGVGFLAYQNMQLKNKTALPENNIVPVTSPIPTATPNPYLNFKTVEGVAIPVSAMIPNDWTVEQSENPDLGNQRMIDAKSPDFAYQGASVSAGYEFRIGPVSDLTKKYDAFEEFSAEVNKDGSYDLVVYNGIKFLKLGTTAQTLIDKTPVTIALYTSPNDENNAIILFNKIMATFKIISTPPISTTPATPSATPSI
jgi:hypothetical protein